MHYTLKSGVDTSTCTFKCEGCGRRFDKSRLYNGRFDDVVMRLTQGLITTEPTSTFSPYGSLDMLRMTCSEGCYSIAPTRKYIDYIMQCT